MDTKVKCSNGTFVGKKTDELIIWKGIPYATQPLGKLRWQKPLPAADNDGVFDATKPGHVPIGPVNDSEASPNSTPTLCSSPSTTGSASWAS